MRNADGLMATVAALDALTTELPQRELLQRGVDIAQQATGSRIAYLHFLNDDQNTIELGVWSRDTLAGCRAVYSRHYPVAAAGIWADSVRFGRPCIHNDYAAAEGKRGLPEGHSPLLRHLGLPVVDEGRLRLLIGVGNKPSDYDADDVALLDLVARRIWSLVRQRRNLEHFIDAEQRLRRVQEIASVCSFEYDVGDDLLGFDAQFGAIFGTRHATERPANLHGFLAFVARADHDAVRAALTVDAAPKSLRIECCRSGGDWFRAELKVEFRPRVLGRGVICIGILQDISEQVVAEDLRRRADTDPLTGLPNRNRLDAWFRQRAGRRGPSQAFAFHYIDLDDFKPVNDRCGHPVGDEVLCVIAQRLQHAVRAEDLVVRMGGDEFVVVQAGITQADAAPVLADKLLATIARPVVVLGHHVEVGASIGIVVCNADASTLNEISADADRALYRAKSAGGRRYVIGMSDCV